MDSGDNSAPLLLAEDMEGNPRISDGDMDTIAVVDMGALEFEARIYNATTGVWYEYIQLAIDDANERKRNEQRASNSSLPSRPTAPSGSSVCAFLEGA